MCWFGDVKYSSMPNLHKHQKSSDRMTKLQDAINGLFKKDGLLIRLEITVGCQRSGAIHNDWRKIYARSARSLRRWCRTLLFCSRAFKITHLYVLKDELEGLAIRLEGDSEQ